VVWLHGVLISELTVYQQEDRICFRLILIKYLVECCDVFRVGVKVVTMVTSWCNELYGQI